MKSNKVKLPVVLGVGAAAVAVGVGASLLLLNKRGPSDLSVAASLVPQDALMTIAVSTDPRQWNQLNQYGTPEARSVFQQNLTGLQQNDLLTACQLSDLRRDVQPWIGSSVLVAFLPSPPLGSAATPNPVQPPTQNSERSEVAWVVPVRDAGAAKRQLERLGSGAASKPTERNHQGYQVREVVGAAGAPTCSASLVDNKYLVFTSSPQLTNQVLDTYKGKPSLASLPGYQRAVQNIDAENPLGQMYLNLPTVFQMVAAQSQAQSGQPVSPEALKRAQEWQGMGVTLNLEPSAMRFKTVAWLRPDSQQKLTARSSSSNLLGQLPADTLMLATGTGIKQTWQESVENSQSNPQLKTGLDDFRGRVKSVTDLDFDQDVVGWMDGEFALSLIPSREGILSDVGAGLVMMFQTSNRKAADAALSKLDKLASRWSLKVGQDKINNQVVTTWGEPSFGSLVAHGWLGNNNTVFLALGAPVVNAVAPKPASPLTADKTFEATTASLPKPNSGYFFLNLKSGLNLLTASPATPTLPPQALAVLKSINTIGASAHLRDERTVNGELLLTLLSQTGNQPNP
ncbi:DUF3352 domain-containing protein [Leptolyngbya sp. FACHB-261]|uniref:DUF3352 domain-containing protein n=1 Tax=Leptolyngbya sp. FACHB-261 TaxID=2692806 RepID=UPI001684B186|nr:DUF3352 domain-containing protein [Leptolyngbya sp. FACHB-261]MBD2100918.1 DUF3352 domain-containing protein [Leptolyngbya sp. FACHB-261]